MSQYLDQYSIITNESSMNDQRTNGGSEGIRTPGHLVKSQMLFLEASYTGRSVYYDHQSQQCIVSTDNHIMMTPVIYYERIIFQSMIDVY